MAGGPCSRPSTGHRPSADRGAERLGELQGETPRLQQAAFDRADPRQVRGDGWGRHRHPLLCLSTSGSTGHDGQPMAGGEIDDALTTQRRQPGGHDDDCLRTPRIGSLEGPFEVAERPDFERLNANAERSSGGDGLGILWIDVIGIPQNSYP